MDFPTVVYTLGGYDWLIVELVKSRAARESSLLAFEVVSNHYTCCIDMV